MPSSHGSHQSHPPALRLQFWGPPGPLLGGGALAPRRERAPGTRQRLPQVRGRDGGTAVGRRGRACARPGAPPASEDRVWVWVRVRVGVSWRGGLSNCTSVNPGDSDWSSQVWGSGVCIVTSIFPREASNAEGWWTTLGKTLILGVGRARVSSSLDLASAHLAGHCVRCAGCRACLRPGLPLAVRRVRCRRPKQTDPKSCLLHRLQRVQSQSSCDYPLGLVGVIQCLTWVHLNRCLEPFGLWIGKQNSFKYAFKRSFKRWYWDEYQGAVVV